MRRGAECPRWEAPEQPQTGAGAPTEHSSSDVCTQPDRSLRTQQAECFSRSRAARMKLCTCGSWRMQGENLAPR